MFHAFDEGHLWQRFVGHVVKHDSFIDVVLDYHHLRVFLQHFCYSLQFWVGENLSDWVVRIVDDKKFGLCIEGLLQTIEVDVPFIV